MYIKDKKGQSTVEYVLLVTAVLAVIIAFVTTNNQGGFRTQLNTSLCAVVDDIGTEATGLVKPWAGTPKQTTTTGQIAPYEVPVNSGVGS